MFRILKNGHQRIFQIIIIRVQIQIQTSSRKARKHLRLSFPALPSNVHTVPFSWISSFHSNDSRMVVGSCQQLETKRWDSGTRSSWRPINGRRLSVDWTTGGGFSHFPVSGDRRKWCWCCARCVWYNVNWMIFIFLSEVLNFLTAFLGLACVIIM